MENPEIHSIQKHIITIHADSQVQAELLEDKCGELVKDKLLNILDEVFSEEAPKNATVRLEKLTLDLGNIDPATLEDDVLNVFKNTAGEALRSALTEVKLLPSPGNEIIPNEISDRDLIIYFLENGTFPWWHKAASWVDFSIVNSFLDLIKQHPDQALEVFRQIGYHSLARSRLVRQFPDSLLKELTGIIQPESKRVILNLLTDLTRIYRKRPFLDLSINKFRDVLWMATFSILIAGLDRPFDPGSFFRSIIVSISQRENIVVIRLIRELMEIGADLTPDITSKDTVKILVKEYQEFSHNLLPKADQTQDWESLLDAFQFYLLSGEMPPSGSLTKTQFLGRIWSILTKKMPDETVGAFRRGWQQSLSRRRFMEDFAEPQFIELVQITEPASARYIISYAQDIGKVEIEDSRLPTKTSGFQQAKWEFIFNYLFIERGSEFNKKMFLKSTLFQITQRYHLEYGEFLKALWASTSELAASPELKKELPALLSELYEEYEEEQILRAKRKPDLAQEVKEEDVELTRYQEIAKDLGLVTAYIKFYLKHKWLPRGAGVTLAGLTEMLLSYPSDESRPILLEFAPSEIVEISEQIPPELATEIRILIKPEKEGISERFEEVFYFLEHGYAKDQKMGLKTLERWLLEAMEAKPDLLLKRLKKLQAREKIQALWAKSISEPVLAKAAYFIQPKFFPDAAEYAERLISGLRMTSLFSKRVIDVKRLKWEFLLEYLSLHPGGLEEFTFVQHFLDFVGSRIEPLEVEGRVSILEPIEKKPPKEKFDVAVEKVLSGLRKKKTEKKEERKIDKEIKKIKDELAEKAESAWKEEELKEPVYISNAGLVLFHPFIPQFFEALKLIENGIFLDEDSPERAAHILQYLVKKTDKAFEHDLVLNKLMCGIPLSETIARDITLTDDEVETCESLLNGVIDHWAKLGETSIDNFRVSFLQREGKIEEVIEGYRLVVEERGYDILMDSLPWSINMFKFPWMEKLIHIEWR